MPPFCWTPQLVDALRHNDWPMAPVFTAADAPRVTEDLDLWDHWPVLTTTGDLAIVDGGLLVIALTAPIFDNPDERHRHARLRLFHRSEAAWRDLGPLLPDGLSPGSREWAGSAVLDPASRQIAAYFTAAGCRGETETSFTQRLFACTVNLDAALRPCQWTQPEELVVPDGITYQTDLSGGGEVGTIKAFRDPYLVKDPSLGTESILFAASRADADSDWNGLVGKADAAGNGWRLAPPLVDATGVNNELERPHLIHHEDFSYLFWSTQRHVFAPELRHAPTGLYGIALDRRSGTWSPINGHCLVFANPEEAPAQAYSWQVLPDLSIWSFADQVAPDQKLATSTKKNRNFIGSPAPILHLRLHANSATLRT